MVYHIGVVFTSLSTINVNIMLKQVYVKFVWTFIVYYSKFEFYAHGDMIR